MKKFFGILLAAVSALVLLPGCGGGGEQETQYMTADDFATARKHFVLGNGRSGTLYIYAEQNSGKPVGDPKIEQTFFGQGFSKATSHGAPLPLSIAAYTVQYNDQGIPVTAQLNLNYDSSVANDNATQEFYDGAELADDANAEFGPVNIALDYTTRRWSMVSQEAAGDNPAVEIGGDFDVRIGLP